MNVVWHVYPGTIGNAGAYIDALQKESKKANINAHSFVSCKYEFDTENTTKFFFPITDRVMNRGKILRCLRGFEILIGNFLVWFMAIFRRPIVNLHLAGPFPPVFFLFCLCKAVRLRTLVTCHDVADNNLYMPQSRMFLLRNADKLIVHSNAAKAMLMNYLNKNEHDRIFQYPFPFSSYDSILKTEKLQEAQKSLDLILSDNIYFLFNGPRQCKGISTLIEAWEKTNAKKNSKLLIAGKWGDVPNETKEKAEQLENCIIVERYLTNEEFVYFIERAKFVLLPYLNYSHSSILISCAKHNGAVIISDIELFKDFLVDYDLVFSQGNPSELALLLDKAYQMDEFEVKKRADILRSSVEKAAANLPDKLAAVYL